MTKEPALVTAPLGTTLSQARELMRWNRYEKLPMVDSNGTLVALLTVRDLLSAEAYANAATDGTGRLKCVASVGTGADVVDRVGALVDAGVDAVVVERPDGSYSGVSGAVARVREAFGTLPIVAGRANTGEGIRALHDAGANTVNVGGAGGIRGGRGGVEAPLLSTLFEASETARELGVPLIARGATAGPGDALKALAIGAAAVEFDPESLALPASAATPPIESLLHQMTSALRSGMAAAGAADLATLRTTLEMKRAFHRD
jgi:IMP dehydrogenase